MKNSAFFKYLFSLLLFGSNGIVASFIELGSLEIVLLRTLIGSLLLLGLFLISGNKFTFFKHKKSFLFLICSGISMGASWMFLYEAYARIGVSISTLLYYSGPIIVMLLSPIFFKEKLTVNTVIGFIAVFAGVLFINGNSISGNMDIFGIACGLLSAVTYSFMVLFNKKASVDASSGQSITGLENSTLQLIIAFVAVSVFVGLKQGYAMEISASSILPILLLGLLNTGIGCYLYFSAIAKIPVQTVAVFGYLEPLSAVLFSFVILKETLLPLQIIGAVLIIGGAMFSELTKKNI